MATFDDNVMLDDFIASYLADNMNTTLEARIVAYNKGRVDVKPIGNKLYTDGDSNAFGILYDLPLSWMAGDDGQAGVKIPVKVGDKCTVYFKQQPQVDGADPEDTRRFSLADAHVVPGVAYPDDLPGNDSVKLYYGAAFLEITKDGVLNINAPGGMNVKTPLATYDKAVTVNGLFTFNAGAMGNGDNGGGGVVTFKGRVVTDLLTVGAKPYETHKHTGVTTGSGTTGNPA